MKKVNKNKNKNNDTIETGLATIYYDTKVYSYQDRNETTKNKISVLYCINPRLKGKSRATGGYRNEADAMADAPYYRDALETISKGAV